MIHSMDGPLCALYHIPHGQACGLVAPAVLKFNAGAALERVAHIFRIMGFSGAEENDEKAVSTGCELLRELLDRLGLLVRLRDIGYEDSHMDNIVRETLKSAQLGTNPRQPAEKDVEKVLKEII